MIYIDDSDAVKADGYKFESLGIVRDGSESTSAKNVYKRGYHVTEACVLTTGNHPVSIFSRIHSSAKKDYKSANTITFDAIEQGAALFGKATFGMESESNALKVAIIKTADPVKEKIFFCYYRLAKGIPAYYRMQKKASGSVPDEAPGLLSTLT